jgi:hypothetical protein
VSKVRTKLLGCISAVAAIAIVAAAHAQPGLITVNGWETTESNAISASPADVLTDNSCHMTIGGPCIDANGAKSPDISFTTNSINFDSTAAFPTPSPPAADTIGLWLGTSISTILPPQTGQMFNNGVGSDTDMDNTIWEFTGVGFFNAGANYQLAHDDGVTLIVDGAPEFSEAGVGGVNTLDFYPYMGGTGNFSFDVVYAECCGAPAILFVDFLAVAVPEPSSLVLLCVALAGIGGALCHRRKGAQPDALLG